MNAQPEARSAQRLREPSRPGGKFRVGYPAPILAGGIAAFRPADPFGPTGELQPRRHQDRSLAGQRAQLAAESCSPRHEMKASGVDQPTALRRAYAEDIAGLEFDQFRRVLHRDEGVVGDDRGETGSRDLPETFEIVGGCGLFDPREPVRGQRFELSDRLFCRPSTRW